MKQRHKDYLAWNCGNSNKPKACASCGKERSIHTMKVCMDSRQMHRYVCDQRCMIEFYK